MKISVITPSIRPEGLKVVQESLANQTLQDFEWLTEIGIPRKGCDLNQSFNRMIRRAKGELIVFYQDYIKIENDGLEKFWDAYLENKKDFITAPVGKTSDWKDIVWDWRKNPEGKVDWLRWEIDWACAPKSALFEIGGFDEELDKFWSFDNVNVGLRAQMAGYTFRNLRTNQAVAFDHDKHEKHPFRERYNPAHHNERLDEIRMGLKIDFLK